MSVEVILGVAFIGPIIFMLVGLIFRQMITQTILDENPDWRYYRWKYFGVGSLIQNGLILGYMLMGWSVSYFLFLDGAIMLVSFVILGVAYKSKKYKIKEVRGKKDDLKQREKRKKAKQRAKEREKKKKLEVKLSNKSNKS